MTTLSIDLETYSSVSLPDCGVYAYTESPDFEILLFGYAFDDGPVQVIDLAQGENMPEEILDALCDPAILKTAFNASFERVCLSAFLGFTLDASQWMCTSVMARELGLPGSLEQVGAVLNLEEQKLKTGKALIRYFCIPCKATNVNGGRTRNLPKHDLERWKLFKEYNARDVSTEREIRNRLLKYSIDSHEWTLYQIDQQINDRGVLADTEFAAKAVQADTEAKDRLISRCKELTGIDNPNSVSQIKDWIFDHTGVVVDSLSKNAIESIKAEINDPQVTELLEIRQGLAKTSTEKYAAVLRTAGLDHRIRGLSQFYGAGRTGRWAGRLVQMQNLPQNKMDDADLDTARQLVRSGDFKTLEMLYDGTANTLSQLVRTAFIPKAGCTFIVSDFSAIEARVIAWFAGEQWRLKVFEEGGDIYCASASQMFKVPVVKHGVNGHLRQKGKIAELALGYGGSVGALVAMGALDMGMEEKELKPLVDAWRKSNPKICNYWWKVGDAASNAILSHKAASMANGVRFRMEGPLLRVRLPSGRELSYVSPEVQDRNIVYKGVIQKTGQWGQVDTYGPKLVENIVQATARDCLAYAIETLEAKGIPVVFHVHDEVICEVPKGAYSAADIAEIMGQDIPWAKGLNLRADAYECEYYRKD